MASSTSVLAAVMSLEWVKEVLILLIVFILLHKFMTADSARSRRKAEERAERKAAMLAFDDADAEEEERPARQRQRRAEPGAARARWWGVDMPGVTDSRFTGTISSYYTENGYGFIRCQALAGKFQGDVFFHRPQMDLAVGTPVSFGVFLSSKSKPQAKDLRPAEPSCVDQDLKAPAPAAPRQEEEESSRKKSALAAAPRPEEESWRNPWKWAATQKKKARKERKKASAVPADHRADEGSDATSRLAQNVANPAEPVAPTASATEPAAPAKGSAEASAVPSPMVERISQDTGRNQDAGVKKSSQRQNNRHQHVSSKKNSGTWDNDWAAWDEWTAWDDWSTQAPEPSEQQQTPKAKRWTLKAKAC